MGKKLKKNISLVVIFIFIFMLLPYYKGNAAEPLYKGELNINSSVSTGTPSDIDVWKITLPSDGTLTLTSSYGHDYGHGFNLYDERGNYMEPLAHVNGGYKNPNNLSMTVNLQQGTYYIWVYPENDCKGYSLSNVFSPTSLPNDLEPNDEAARALPLELNSSKTGHLNYLRYYTAWDEVDWYKVQITTEGKLDIKVTATSSLQTNLVIYNENIINDPFGPNELLEAVSPGNPNTSINLRPGTYYVELTAEDNENTNPWDDFGEYTITSTFTPLASNNDLEPNDNASDAVILGTDDLKTGNIGHNSYYKNNQSVLGKDIVDWYKVQLPSDGKLKITATTDEALEVNMSLINSDGREVLEEDTRTGTFSNIENYLSAGIYYIKIFLADENDEGYGVYTIATVFDSNNKGGAKELKINSAASGDLSYEEDTELWYITIPSDGTLSITVPEDKVLTLYDADGSSEIEKQNTDTDYTATAHLKAGTYYLKVYANYSQGSYEISNSFNPTSKLNDAEPNDLRSDAFMLSLNDLKTGHLGYYSLLASDYEDWYKLEIGSEGSLTIETTTDDTLTTVLELQYLDEGLPFVGRAEATGTAQKLQVTLKPGTYYIYLSVDDPANSDKTYGEYTIKTSFSPKNPGLNDLEPNDTANSALPLSLYDTKTGCIGHESFDINNSSDTDLEDWYIVNISNDGVFRVNLNTTINLNAGLVIFDKDEEVVLGNRNSSETVINLEAALSKGTYYVQVCAYDDNCTPGSYTLTSSFASQGLDNDIEPNDVVNQAIVLNNNISDTGHLGYYSNSAYDNADWYKFQVAFNSFIQIKVSTDTALKAEISLMDSIGVSLVSDSSHKTELTIAKYLKPGTYYIKIDRDSGYGGYTVLQRQAVVDINHDSKVDIIDLALLSQSYNMKNSSSNWNEERDLNKDGIIDIYDLVIVSKGI